MHSAETEPVRRERLLQHQGRWWFLGPGGVARLGRKQVTADRAIAPAAERRLREAGLYDAPAPTAWSLTVLTSTDCNLGCGYCFQNTGQDLTGGNRPSRIAHARLTSETITSVLEFADKQMSAAGLSKLALILFGGEPLLNPRGCVDLLERAGDHGLVHAMMISNLTLLTPSLAKRLADRGLASVQVTFDGDRADHDEIRVRRSRADGGTFDSIVSGIVRASEVTPLRWIIRVNVSHRNQAGIGTLIDRLAAALDPSRCSLYLARVADVGIGYGNDLKHTEESADRFIGWQRQALDAGFAVPQPGPRPLCQTCGHRGGRYGAVVSADGTLSSCWDTAGQAGWQVGTVHTGYLPDSEVAKPWVGCEDLYQYTADQAELELFKDRVDAALLEDLYAAGKL